MQITIENWFMLKIKRTYEKKSCKMKRTGHEERVIEIEIERERKDESQREGKISSEHHRNKF